MGKFLTLNLDALYEQGYYYTIYDVGGSGHSITIKEEDKEKFLDEFAQKWREQAEELLEEYIEDDEEVVYYCLNCGFEYEGYKPLGNNSKPCCVEGCGEYTSFDSYVK